MSTNEETQQDRTPAPAGSMSRVIDHLEASRFGLREWILEEVPVSGLLPAKPSRSEPNAPQRAEADCESRLLEQEQRYRKEMEAAVQRTRQESDTKTQAILKSEVEPWLKRMAQSIEDIATVRQRYLAESEDQLVRLAVAVARRILHREIQVDTEALFGLIHAATQRAELRELNRILLNPKDHQALLPYLEQLQLPPRVEVIPDPALERGALLLESASGILDASIQAQLDEVERGFIDLLGRR